MIRRERCACGGLIVVASTEPEPIFAAVWRHNLTDLHLAWRSGGVA